MSKAAYSVTTEQDDAQRKASIELYALMQEKQRRMKYDRMAHAWPETGPLRRELYPKHMAFFEMGAHKRIRAIFGANRSGKSESAAYELACHLTGRYPAWWVGKRFNRPIRAWAASNTLVTTREALQRKLIGPKNDTGTGFVPQADIKQIAAGAHDAIDFATVKHASGLGRSTVIFKTYEQGREKFQADEVDVIVLDEEPPDYGIYTECVTRTATTNGIVILAFTALKGITPLVCKFMPEFARGTDLEVDHDDGSSRGLTIIGWDDAPHLTEESKRQMKAEYAPHEISARTTGMPSIGSGSIYPIPEREFVIDPVKGGLPEHWPRVYALDPGHNRTAAVWGAWDQSEDCVYLYSEHYSSQVAVEMHAAAIKARGLNIRGVSDDSTNVEGGTTVDLYRKHGLLVQKAQKSEKEARIHNVYSRLATGRLKVYSTLHNWLFEFRMYRRDEKGHIVKEHDHLMDATGYLIQSGLAIARPARRPPETEVITQAYW